MGIVAEGVETQAQADFLKAHGCDEAQGYHLGRPMPESAFEALLMAHSTEAMPAEQADEAAQDPAVPGDTQRASTACTS